MPGKEGDRFTSEIWSILGSPLPENLIDTYVKYASSLPPHERRFILQVPNPNDGHIEVKLGDLRSNLEERTPAGIYITLIIFKDTLNEMPTEEKSETIENPQFLIAATIKRLEADISKRLKLTTLDPSASHYF